VCTVCDSIADKVSHVWSDWTITKKATHSVDGSRERTCSECGYKMSETIPALKDRSDPTTEAEKTTEPTTDSSTEVSTEQVTDGSTEVTTETTTETTTGTTMETKKSAPNTGDTENVALYIIICGLSIAGMILAIGKKRGFDKK
jgi:LPXTG-motif cell wall-anchored protein